MLYSRFGAEQRLGDVTLSAADRQKVKDKLRAILRQLAPKANLAFVDDLVDGKATGKWEGLKSLVTVSLGYGDPEVTIGHEAIHALKEMGLIDPVEWAVFERAVRGSETLREVERLYPNATKAEQVEEAIAQMFGEFRAGKSMLPRYRRIFAKVRDFLTRLANALRGLGFQSAESIFAKVESGEVGRRPEGYAGRKGETGARYAAAEMPASVEENIARGKEAMDRVIAEHTDMRRAMYRPEVGWISFFWGRPGDPHNNYRKGEGVSHIIARRDFEGKPGETIARHMVETIARGSIGDARQVGRNLRRNLVFGKYTAVLDLQHYPSGDAWLLTGFHTGPWEEGSDASDRPLATDQSYAPQPRGSSDEAGAEPGRSIGPDGGDGQSPSGSDEAKYSLFNLKRQAAPHLAQPEQNAGSDEVRDILQRHIGSSDVPFRQGIRDHIDRFRNLQLDALKQAWLDRFHAVRALGETVGRLGPWKALQLTKNIRSVMAVVLRHGPLEIYNDPKLGQWFRLKQDWKGGGFEQLFKPLVDKGQLDLWKGWMVARRADRLLREGRVNSVAAMRGIGIQTDNRKVHFAGPSTLASKPIGEKTLGACSRIHYKGDVPRASIVNRTLAYGYGRPVRFDLLPINSRRLARGGFFCRQ